MCGHTNQISSTICQNANTMCMIMMAGIVLIAVRQCCACSATNGHGEPYAKSVKAGAYVTNVLPRVTHADAHCVMCASVKDERANVLNARCVMPMLPPNNKPPVNGVKR